MKPRALDLFCGAGGATRGLQRAGFHVTGFDVERQPNYCGDEFIKADATSVPAHYFDRFDFVWASPPCQAFTAYKRRPGHVAPRANLIPLIRRLIWSSTLGPYVIENVPGAPLKHPVMLCGSSFGLDVRRHRIFEASFPLAAPACSHASQAPRFPPSTNRKNLRRTVEVGVWRIPLETQKRAMGVDWDCTLHELSQMVPPAYAEYIGKAAARLVRQKEAA